MIQFQTRNSQNIIFFFLIIFYESVSSIAILFIPDLYTNVEILQNFIYLFLKMSSNKTSSLSIDNGERGIVHPLPGVEHISILFS